MVVILGYNWDSNNAQLYSVPIIDAKSWDLFTTVIGFAPSARTEFVPADRER
jgi:hypothetical protein